MNLAMLAEMAASGGGDRVAIGPMVGGVTYEDVWGLILRAASWFDDRSAQNVVLVDVNSMAFPVGLFGAAVVGKPFAPMNFRWGDDQLRDALGRIAPATVIVQPAEQSRLGGVRGIELIDRTEFLTEIASAEPFAGQLTETDEPAVLLFTSGTTGRPKVAVLRHDNLVGYILATVDFQSADPADAQLVAVPPYHIAGIANLLSALYAGRRIVHMEAFDPDAWLQVARAEQITHAMVVPTMLARILDVADAAVPTLRHLSYGGGRMPLPVIESAIARFPNVGFVNAYGLTETSSTVAVLGPEDHRSAISSTSETVRRRLASVGRPIPSVEVEIRDANGQSVPPNVVGEIYVRGAQVSGEYVEGGAVTDQDGWFATKDGGYLDEDGYLFVEGRLDDVIVRGGENISPAEVEDALVSHPAVVDAAVVGVPDEEWGETVAAAVVLKPATTLATEELQEWVRARIRSAKTPSIVVFRPGLPYNDNGKLLRSQLRSELKAALGGTA